jgi:hypothetical protein
MYQSASTLQLYWRFEEGSGTTTTDSSGNGHGGTTPVPVCERRAPPTNGSRIARNVTRTNVRRKRYAWRDAVPRVRRGLNLLYDPIREHVEYAAGLVPFVRSSDHLQVFAGVRLPEERTYNLRMTPRK